MLVGNQLGSAVVANAVLVSLLVDWCRFRCRCGLLLSWSAIKLVPVSVRVGDGVDILLVGDQLGSVVVAIVGMEQVVVVCCCRRWCQLTPVLVLKAVWQLLCWCLCLSIGVGVVLLVSIGVGVGCFRFVDVSCCHRLVAVVVDGGVGDSVGCCRCWLSVTVLEWCRFSELWSLSLSTT